LGLAITLINLVVAQTTKAATGDADELDDLMIMISHNF
jgi:hypothetical protein